MLNWLFKTDDGDIVIYQFPNWSLLLAISLWLISNFVDAQPYNNLAVMLYRLLLMYWASLEIKTGVNNFRSILGTIVFVVILIGFLNQLL